MLDPFDSTSTLAAIGTVQPLLQLLENFSVVRSDVGLVPPFPDGIVTKPLKGLDEGSRRGLCAVNFLIPFLVFLLLFFLFRLRKGGGGGRERGKV